MIKWLKKYSCEHKWQFVRCENISCSLSWSALPTICKDYIYKCKNCGKQKKEAGMIMPNKKLDMVLNKKYYPNTSDLNAWPIDPVTREKLPIYGA
jgi:hypothetical protein